jgi:hypothetical protein
MYEPRAGSNEAHQGRGVSSDRTSSLTAMPVLAPSALLTQAILRSTRGFELSTPCLAVCLARGGYRRKRFLKRQ